MCWAKLKAKGNEKEKVEVGEGLLSLCVRMNENGWIRIIKYEGETRWRNRSIKLKLKGCPFLFFVKKIEKLHKDLPGKMFGWTTTLFTENMGLFMVPSNFFHNRNSANFPSEKILRKTSRISLNFFLGFSSIMAIVSELDLGVVLLWNTQDVDSHNIVIKVWVNFLGEKIGCKKKVI